MDAEEGTVGRAEHRISVASGSGESVGTDEEVSVPAIEPSVDERWMKEVQEKSECALRDLLQGSKLSDDERRPTICKFVLSDEFSHPRMVAIGPFHRHESTRFTDKEKWWIVYFMNLYYSVDLARCLAKMKDQVADALACYSSSDISQSVNSKDDKWFAEMLLLDCYFILFMLMFNNVQYSVIHRRPKEILQSRDPQHVVEMFLHQDKIMLDLLILDNQIPFFVIEELYKELKLKKPLYDYAVEFFEKIHPTSARGRNGQSTGAPKFLHLLHLFHWSRVPANKYDLDTWSHQQMDEILWARYTPTATELTKSATMFQKKTSGSSLDITFRRRRLISVIGELGIPDLHIRDYSSFIFHHLIAFEMQCPRQDRHTMAFCAVMQNLLRSEEDVELLRRRGILPNTSMTDDGLVDFFKHLNRLIENYQMPIELHALYDRVLSHHNRRTSRFCGHVILQYFSNPLVTLSVFAAAMLFVLTLLQTIYSMLSYYHS